MPITKEEILEALREGRVSCTVFYSNGTTKTVQIPPETPTEVKKVDSQKKNLAVLPELPHIRN